MVKVCTFFIIIFSLSVATVSPAHAALEFSASLIVSPAGSTPYSGKIFVKGQKIRQELPGPGGTQIMIFRPDIELTWILTSPGKMCMQMAYLPSDNPFGEWAALKSKSARFIGKDAFYGMPCSKYRAVEDGKDTLYWISDQFSFPVKIQNRDETIECENINRCRLKDSLFEIPAYYRKTINTIAPPEE
ncbi:MAG: hypothetical protein ACP5IL_10665 [Syntrophobacteraceae bacterium]